MLVDLMMGSQMKIAGSAISLALVVGTTGCSTTAESSYGPEIHVRHLPPTAADVMEAAIRSHGIDNTVDRSCDNFGHWFDQTMGRQFAYLIEGLEQGKRGWVEIRTASRRAPSGMYWRAVVLFQIDTEGPDPYSGGADFLIRQSDGLVIPSSFKCPGL